LPEAQEESNQQAEEVVPFCLPPDCGLHETEEFIDSIRDSNEDVIVIDASQVEKMSASCTLAIASLIRQPEADFKKITVLSAAPPFLDSFSDLGLFQDLMKMEFRQ